MKLSFIALLLIASTSTFAQTQPKVVTHYLELTAEFSGIFNDDILLNNVKPPKKQAGYSDTCINYKAINNIIRDYRTPMAALNILSEDGWSLVSTVNVPDGRYTRETIIYYLKKDFKH